MTVARPDKLIGLYTRIPTAIAVHLDGLSAATGRAKQQIVTEIFERALSSQPPKAAPPQDVLTLDEVAALLRVEPHDVLTSIESNRLPGRRIGAGWRFSRAALEAWLAEPEPRDDRAIGFTPSAKATQGRPTK
jgi:excisionase family DNA binding protein